MAEHGCRGPFAVIQARRVRAGPNPWQWDEEDEADAKNSH